jgi:hypothetical protein
VSEAPGVYAWYMTGVKERRQQRIKAKGKERWGSLAQSVEQQTFNLLVDGSNPSRPITLRLRGFV